MKSQYDVVILGAGHNGLVAAGYLGRTGLSVLLLPQKIIRDLGLNLELRRRAIASFTPYVSHGQHGALVLTNLDENVSRKSIIDLTGSDAEFERVKKFYTLPRVFAEQVWDSMLE